MKKFTFTQETAIEALLLRFEKPMQFSFKYLLQNSPDKKAQGSKS